MARTVQELLDRLLAFLPPEYESAEPLLAALATAMWGAELAADSILDVLPFGPAAYNLSNGTPVSHAGATGIWLDLHAAGYGLHRAPGELDAQLQTRLRSVADRVTKPSIQDAVDNLLLPFGVTAVIVEWWDEPYLDVAEPITGGLYLDSTFISGGHHSFLVVVPSVGLGFNVSPDPFLNVDAWLDSMFLGSDVSDPVYAAIVAEVERLRAAGVQWRLVIGSPP